MSDGEVKAVEDIPRVWRQLSATDALPARGQSTPKPEEESKMGVESNKKSALAFFEASAEKNIDRIDSLLTDDATWWASPTTPLAGTYSKAEFLAMLPNLFEVAIGPLTIHIGAITAEDDRVSVTAKGDIKLNNGKTYASHYHFLFYFKDGKIAAAKEYADTAHVNEIFGPGGLNW